MAIGRTLTAIRDAGQKSGDMQSGEIWRTAGAERGGQGGLYPRRKGKGAWAVHYQYYAGIPGRVTAQNLYIHNPVYFRVQGLWEMTARLASNLMEPDGRPRTQLSHPVEPVSYW